MNLYLVIGIDCGDPGVPINGDTTVTSTTFGSMATHTCNDGFVLVGVNKQICLANGNWSASLPTCESKHCHIH